MVVEHRILVPLLHGIECFRLSAQVHDRRERFEYENARFTQILHRILDALCQTPNIFGVSHDIPFMRIRADQSGERIDDGESIPILLGIPSELVELFPDPVRLGTRCDVNTTHSV